jgi:elongator complex protein 2
VLASGSQDNTIRLWNIEPYVKSTTLANGVNGTGADDLLDAFEESLGDLGESEEGGRQISLKRHILTVKNQQYSITFDALLVGHEAGVTSLSWCPRLMGSETSAPSLLSTSVDSSVIIWSPSTVIASSSADGATVLWINRQRFGDVGGQRLGGFVGGLWVAEGRQAIAWGWSGGWRAWRCVDIEQDIWEETGGVTGHKGQVKGLAWAPAGEYLISVGYALS